MMQRIALAAALWLLPTLALAANCNSNPFTLTNGQTADATQVMANFNNLLNCGNNNLAHNGANSDITSLSGLTTPISVAQGGTGLATLTANGLLVGNGTGTPTLIVPSTNGNLLQSVSGAWLSTNLWPANLPTKTIAVTADTIVIGDSAASFAAKVTNVSGFLSGVTIQTATTASSSVTTDTNGITFNNSVPTTSNGSQFLSASFTAKSASSTLLITVMGNLSSAASNANLFEALFKDASSTAAQSSASNQANPTRISTVPLVYTVAAGDTSAHTWTVRGGADNGTTTFNGASGGAIFGGTLTSTITITEIHQ